MKKGFTLIELLAVILILGVIAVIAIPIVSSIIKESKLEAFKRTSSNYLKALEDKCMINKINGGETNIEIDIKDGVSTKSDILSEIIKGKIVDQVLMSSNEECQVDMALYDNNLNVCIYKLANSEEINSVNVSNRDRCILGINVKDDSKLYTSGYHSSDTSITPTDSSCFSFNQFSGQINSYNENCPKDVIIPAYINGIEVTKIAYQSFKNKEIESVLMPETIVYIGVAAFEDNNIATLGLGEGIENIEERAFRNNKLTEVIIPDSVESVAGFNENKLEKVVLGSGVRNIGLAAFENNPTLTEVDFSAANNLATINNVAFSNTGLTHVDLPSSLTTIKIKAFMNSKLTSITIPENVTTIEGSAFKETPLTRIDIVNKTSLSELTLGPSWNGSCNNINFITK